MKRNFSFVRYWDDSSDSLMAHPHLNRTTQMCGIFFGKMKMKIFLHAIFHEFGLFYSREDAALEGEHHF